MTVFDSGKAFPLMGNRNDIYDPILLKMSDLFSGTFLVEFVLNLIFNIKNERTKE